MPGNGASRWDRQRTFKGELRREQSAFVAEIEKAQRRGVAQAGACIPWEDEVAGASPATTTIPYWTDRWRIGLVLDLDCRTCGRRFKRTEIQASLKIVTCGPCRTNAKHERSRRLAGAPPARCVTCGAVLRKRSCRHCPAHGFMAKWAQRRLGWTPERSLAFDAQLQREAAEERAAVRSRREADRAAMRRAAAKARDDERLRALTLHLPQYPDVALSPEVAALVAEQRRDARRPFVAYGFGLDTLGKSDGARPAPFIADGVAYRLWRDGVQEPVYSDSAESDDGYGGGNYVRCIHGQIETLSGEDYAARTSIKCRGWNPSRDAYPGQPATVVRVPKGYKGWHQSGARMIEGTLFIFGAEPVKRDGAYRLLNRAKYQQPACWIAEQEQT